MRERLSEGRSLAKRLLESQSLDLGRVVTFFPSTTNEELVKSRFRHGGVLPEGPPETHVLIEGGIAVPISDTSDELIMIIESYLSKSKRAICIFEEALVRPTDPIFLSRSSITASLLYKDEIHYILRHKDDLNRIEQTTMQAKNFYPGLIGAMTSSPSEEMSFDEGKISADQLQLLAERTETIVLGAYDGEGYLLWKHTKHE